MSDEYMEGKLGIILGSLFERFQPCVCERVIPLDNALLCYYNAFHTPEHMEFVPIECRHRPYHVEYAGSRPITEDKQRWAPLVLGRETAWEHRVLMAYFSNFI